MSTQPSEAAVNAIIALSRLHDLLLDLQREQEREWSFAGSSSIATLERCIPQLQAYLEPKAAKDTYLRQLADGTEARKDAASWATTMV